MSTTFGVSYVVIQDSAAFLILSALCASPCKYAGGSVSAACVWFQELDEPQQW